MRVSRISAAILLCFLTACGANPNQSTSTPKIVGGTTASARPFMAALVRDYDTSSFCGGAFISPDVVMTAAHCVSPQLDDLRVAGGHRYNRNLTPERTRQVTSIVVHEGYDRNNSYNDIALLFLANNDRNANSVRPASVSASPTLPENLGTAWVAGWGDTSFEGEAADELREVKVPIIDSATCRSAGGEYSSITNSQICAGDFERGGIDSCQGDSGGPLFVERDNNVQIIGIVSWGEGCADARKPGVYTRVASFKNWISKVLAER